MICGEKRECGYFGSSKKRFLLPIKWGESRKQKTSLQRVKLTIKIQDKKTIY